MTGPLSKQCSTSKILNSEAPPKEISERTSYLQVRLEFHRYPHLIPAFFNRHGFGLQCILPPFTLDMGRSPGFGYITTYFIRPFQTRFRCGSGFSTLTLHVIMTRRFILQARRHPLTGSDSLWAHGFRNYFTPLPGCFSPFPHGTGSLSVTRSI